MQLTVGEIADIIDGKISGDARVEINGVAVFETAASTDITYIDSAKFLKTIGETRAGGVIVPEDFGGPAPCPVIRTANPKLGFARILEVFHPDQPIAPGISPRADIGENTVIGQDVSINAFVSIGARVSLGDRVNLYPGVCIGADTIIGDDTVIYPNVTIMDHCCIGKRVKIHAGSVIGSDGFGFVPDGNTHFKIKHIGSVQIDEDVEIGANNTIDRGTFGKTHICRGVKTDNLVHVAHNVTVGEDTLLVGQVGIAGSASIGKHAIVAAQAGVGQHVTVGDNAIVGPQAGLTKSIEKGAIYSGTLAMPHNLWMRAQGVMRHLPALKKKIDKIEKRLHLLDEDN
ncbi:MAG: UDP-3-O-(3-hydroxymyristoyl)glucosamine N-acyltransferase [Desulfobacterales bacterium]|nr:UDP-3-O-(3-hydroxymyristoyl)glucosamine N-acyltransferase [Desulfobacterales bacterium]